MAEGYKNWEILVRFYDFRGWRIVDAKDASGRQTQCLLLPMDANGIQMTKKSHRPYMTFISAAIPPGKSPDGFFRTVTPLMPTSFHDELVEKGVIDPDLEHWTRTCGGIRGFGFRKAKKP